MVSQDIDFNFSWYLSSHVSPIVHSPYLPSALLYHCHAHVLLPSRPEFVHRLTNRHIPTYYYILAADVRLKQDATSEKNDIKLLLLGAGESGKTTIKTQMRYIEGNPLTDEEKEQFSEWKNPLL